MAYPETIEWPVGRIAPKPKHAPEETILAK